MKTSVSISIGVVVLLVIAVTFAYFYFEPRLKSGGYTIPTDYSPDASVPDVNPTENTNPFSNLKTNPFE